MCFWKTLDLKDRFASFKSCFALPKRPRHHWSDTVDPLIDCIAARLPDFRAYRSFLIPKMAAPKNFECALCLDTHDGIPILLTEDEEPVCQPCFIEQIRPMFEEALRFEYLYPVRWGSEVLEPHRYAKFLPPVFILQWFWKEREYKTPGGERVYCSHRVLIEDGTRGPFRPKAISAQKAARFNIKTQACGRFFGVRKAGGVHVCFACGGLTCSGCGAPHFLPGQEPPFGHSCNPEKKAEDTDDAFTSLKKGEAYQVCPGCSIRVSLGDGCNQMTCPRRVQSYLI